MAIINGTLILNKNPSWGWIFDFFGKIDFQTFSKKVSDFNFFSTVKKNGKNNKSHVLGDSWVIFGLVFQKIFKKSIFRVIEQKILFFENLM